MRKLVTIQATVVTSPLALARLLWRHGEPELAARAYELGPDEVLDIGVRAGELQQSGAAVDKWSDGPRYRSLLLAAVEKLQGACRPCLQSEPRPERDLPELYQATEEQRRAALDAVNRVMAARRESGHPVP